LYEDVSPAEFRAQSDTGQKWQLLDVREDWEIEIAAVPGSIRIPMAEVPSRQSELDDSVPVAVLCHSGVRSARVAGYLVAQGFSRVVNIAGGIDAWALEVDDSMPRY